MAAWSRLILVFVCCATAVGPVTAAEPVESNAIAAATATQLALLEGGTLAEQTAAARWLGLHQAKAALAPLRRKIEAAPRDAAHAEFLRTARLMELLLYRPQDLEFHSLDNVVAGLADPAVNTRMSAVRHLAYYAPANAVDLAAPFLDDPEALVREQALTTLGHLGDDSHAARALELLEDLAAAVRLRALEYLLTLDRPDLLPRLVELTADSNRWIAQPAVRALAANGGGPAAVGAILARLPNVTSTAVLARYLTALECFDERDAWPDGWTDEVRPLLTHSDTAVRQAAAVLLGDGAPNAARDVLLGLLASDDALERLAAAHALVDGGWEVDVGTIALLLEDDVAAVRVAAVDLTATLSPARRRTLLRAVIARSDEEADVLSRALAGLAEVGRADDVAFLVERAGQADSSHVLVNAALTMAVLEQRWDTQVARSWYREQLADPAVTHATRQAIVRALQVVGDPSFLPLLADELRAAPTGDTRYAAAVIQTMSTLVGRQVHGADFAGAGVQ